MAASPSVQTMGPAAARRTALAAQGFADPRPAGPVTRRHLLRVLARIGLLQLDSVTVLARAHYLPVFSRLGPYPRELLDGAQELGGGALRRPGSWWNRTDTKRICEWLFGIGELTTGTRRGFQRLYDLPERVLPPEVLAHRVDAQEGARELIIRAATALGVATEPDLRDYYRLRPQCSRQAVAELVEAGELEPVLVGDWPVPAYRHRDARTPRRITDGDLAAALGAAARPRAGGVTQVSETPR